MILDTHVIIWLLTDDPRLGPKTRQKLRHEPRLTVSVVTPLEIELKKRKGKLEIIDLNIFEDQSNFRMLPLKLATIKRLASLKQIDHDDPFDLLLIAQALQSNLPLLSADRKLLSTK